MNSLELRIPGNAQEVVGSPLESLGVSAFGDELCGERLVNKLSKLDLLQGLPC